MAVVTIGAGRDVAAAVMTGTIMVTTGTEPHAGTGGAVHVVDVK